MPQVTKQVQDAIIEYATYILDEHKNSREYVDKMEVIDKAYSLYKQNTDPVTGVVHGEGIYIIQII